MFDQYAVNGGSSGVRHNRLFDTDAQGRPPCGSYSSVAGQLRR
jgi:hypothetical protein